MLTGSELRIGNFICKFGIDYNNGEPFINKDWQEVVKVDFEVMKEIKAFNGTTDFIYFEPIPLTEEWLLNFGAKKTDKKDNFGGFIVYYPNGNGMRIKDNEWNSQHITVNVKHVHQLQNLYFALTGKELLCEV